MEFKEGVDLGKRKSHIKVMTADRKIVEHLKVDNSAETFRRIFGNYKGQIEVACEASSNAFCLAADSRYKRAQGRGEGGARARGRDLGDVRGR
jgi:hypothetical protein